MPKVAERKVVVGFVVKREWFEEDPTTKTRVKYRKELSRVFHARSAAETMVTMYLKEHPDWTVYIHEKTRRDDTLI